MKLRALLFMVVWLPLYGIALEGAGEAAEVGAPMWLRVPDTIREEAVLWKGPLKQGGIPTPQPPDRPSPETAQKPQPPDRPSPQETVQVRQPPVPGYGGLQPGTIGPLPARDVPVVSIGQPEIWPLPQVYPPQKMPLLMQAQLKEADFYLIRLFCSFRPIPGQTRVGWARFHVFLLPDAAGRQPIAYDISPLEINQEVKRHLKFTLAPTLKFQSVDMDMGSLEFGMEYPELQPIIIGAGVGEAAPTWDYKTAAGVKGVQGAKWMHLLIKAPKGMRSGKARLDLTAQVYVDSLLYWVPFLLPPEVRNEYLSIQLWP